MNHEFKKQFASATIAFIVFCSSALLYALVDLNEREAVETVSKTPCRSCPLIIEEMNARNVTPLALR